ncbi:hypothetical protein GWI33_015063 [Rhynchophorus ferrugineus]|uniref:Uncharacterized protein n=1 Tax=Rhynchophorus ferrugineus TaxID=354439 RepID=A0A834I4L7_RHYFE|nr:hypothetical protein GWI33_015063 [Rhynchophorus ferrugineus]
MIIFREEQNINHCVYYKSSSVKEASSLSEHPGPPWPRYPRRPTPPPTPPQLLTYSTACAPDNNVYNSRGSGPSLINNPAGGSRYHPRGVIWLPERETPQGPASVSDVPRTESLATFSSSRPARTYSATVNAARLPMLSIPKRVNNITK